MEANEEAAAASGCPVRRGWRRYLDRHRRPACRVLHAVGVPLLVAGLVLAGVQLTRGQWSLWWRPLVLIVVSYVLQWWGHRIEGNDMGEVVLIKKLLGLPYQAVAPRGSMDGADGGKDEP